MSKESEVKEDAKVEPTEDSVAKEEKSEPVIQEKPEQPKELKEPKDTTEEKSIDGEKEKEISPFVTEQDTFDVSVRFYRIDKEVVVEGIDDEFDPKYKDITVFTCTFKYVSQGDSELILSLARTAGDAVLHQLNMHELARLEFARLATILRGWSLEADWDNENLMKLHPRIVRALCIGIRSVIGFDGLL